jgi:hypothetical protein
MDDRTLEKRVEAMERSVRRWRTLTALLVGAGVCVGLAGAAQQGDRETTVIDTLAVRRIWVYDANKKIRINISVLDNTPMLRMTDTSDSPTRVLLAAPPDGAATLTLKKGDVTTFKAP